jgi:hypothetical protein
MRHLRPNARMAGRGRTPAPRPGPVVQLKELSARAKTHFALDPALADSDGEETFWPLRAWPELDELETSPLTEVHIIVTKSGNLKVLQRQTRLLPPHCYPATTL